MNKLIFFCLLSLMIVYIQSADDDVCSKVESPKNQADCDAAKNVPSGKACKFIAESGEGENKKDAHCEMVNKATNSSDNLNIFKITLTLLIIFTIL